MDEKKLIDLQSIRKWLRDYEHVGVNGSWPESWPIEACALIDEAWTILQEIERGQRQ